MWVALILIPEFLGVLNWSYENAESIKRRTFFLGGA